MLLLGLPALTTLFPTVTQTENSAPVVSYAAGVSF
jgi:hypothetical protein